MTDGAVGNNLQILAEVQNHPNARVFAFGIGSSTNRFLLDKMAEYGRGEVEYVGLEDDGSAAAKRFHERVRSPLLTDISVEWSGLPVTDVYPRRIPDLFSAKPVILSGRYSGAAKGAIRLRGKMAGKDFTREIAVSLPQSEARHDVLASLWARRRIDDLMGKRTEAKEAITQIGLEFNLMTQFTSFVAVEESVVTEGSKPRRIEVPVEMPYGMSYEGVYGRRDMAATRGKVFQMQLGVVGGVAVDMARTKRPFAPEPAPPVNQVVATGADLKEMDQSVRKIDPWLPANMSPTVRVQIWTTDTSKETLARFKSLGVEVESITQPGKLIIATVNPSRLGELAKLNAVQYISPLK